MRRVVLESPFAGEVERNIAFARACVRDCLQRGEAPIASHLLFTQRDVLDDGNQEERKLGIAAGHAWTAVADAVVVYTNLGISTGMKAGIDVAEKAGVLVEMRSLQGWAA